MAASSSTEHDLINPEMCQRSWDGHGVTKTWNLQRNSCLKLPYARHAGKYAEVLWNNIDVIYPQRVDILWITLGTDVNRVKSD